MSVAFLDIPPTCNDNVSRDIPTRSNGDVSAPDSPTIQILEAVSSELRPIRSAASHGHGATTAPIQSAWSLGHGARGVHSGTTAQWFGNGSSVRCDSSPGRLDLPVSTLLETELTIGSSGASRASALRDSATIAASARDHVHAAAAAARVARAVERHAQPADTTVHCC
jgi:hypothetical protein